MEHNVGFDGGTTYSVISRIEKKYNDEGNLISSQPVVCYPYGTTNPPCVDSMVARDADGDWYFGLDARNEAGTEGVTVYKGFKMLLTERNPAVLAERHYDAQYTPEDIMERFLGELLQKYLSTVPEEDHISKLVVGVPEIWKKSVGTLDSRAILQDILEKFGFIDTVELVSEPEAACAYFVNNYQKIHQGTPFEGHVLLVDYGGGTLDIALCRVQRKDSGNEVEVICRAGAGENEEGTVGKAGMAFVEGVTLLALEGSGLQRDEILADEQFPAAVQSVENDLMKNQSKIANRFAGEELMEWTEIGDEFTKVRFGKKKHIVTYGMLAQAYGQVIEPVLDAKLDEIIGYMDANGIQWRGGKEDTFKAALAGGFCDFYLTQDQIQKKLAYAPGDRRFQGMVTKPGERQMAVAFGAALIADSVTSVKQSAPFHLGFAKGTREKATEVFWAIHKGDEIVYNEPVFIRNAQGEEQVFVGSGIPMLAFSLEDDPEYGMWGDPTDRYRKQLELTKGKYYKIGFSLDRSMRITIHKHIVEHPSRREVVLDKASVKLGGDMYKYLGAISEVRRIKG